MSLAVPIIIVSGHYPPSLCYLQFISLCPELPPSLCHLQFISLCPDTISQPLSLAVHIIVSGHYPPITTFQKQGMCIACPPSFVTSSSYHCVRTLAIPPAFVTSSSYHCVRTLHACITHPLSLPVHIIVSGHYPPPPPPPPPQPLLLAVHIIVSGRYPPSLCHLQFISLCPGGHCHPDLRFITAHALRNFMELSGVCTMNNDIII